MKKLLVALVAVAVVCGAAVENTNAEVSHRLGVGVHYWKALDDIDVDEVDENGLSYYLTYQLRPATLIKFELDVEMLPDGYGGSDDDVFAPQAYVILGGGIYAALGVGTYYTDGDFSSDPFFGLRAGLDLHLLPYIYLDINANYRFEDWDDISDVDEDISTDTITLGAAVRVQF
jgi:hypothetical protein